MVIVTRAELSNLGQTHYSATDKSILGPYMQVYWNWALRFIPLRMHPNVVTYMGFMWLLTAVLWVSYYDYQYTFAASAADGARVGTTEAAAAVPQLATTNAPWYVWVWSAVAIFMYQTFDALDGKQARRIKSGSSVGEIVDHSADAVTTIFVQYLLTSAIFRDSPLRGFVLTMMVLVGFFVSHWEHYVTHLFYLGYLNGPTEGLLLTAFFFLLTGAFGPALWSDPSYYFLPTVSVAMPPSVTPYIPTVLNEFKIANNADIVFHLTFWMAFFTVVPSIITTCCKFLRKPNNSLTPHVSSHPPRLHPPVRVYEALARTALPFFYLSLLAVEYVHEFPLFHAGNFFLVEVALGWVAALAATRVTVRRLTGAPYGFCTVSYFTTFLGLVLPLLAHKGRAIFGDDGGPLIAASANAPFVSTINNLCPSTVAQLFLSSELQWFANNDNMRQMWLVICVLGGIEYVHYCWRLLVLMAKHLGINLLVLTETQLAFVATLEAEMKKQK